MCNYASMIVTTTTAKFSWYLGLSHRKGRVRETEGDKINEKVRSSLYSSAIDFPAFLSCHLLLFLPRYLSISPFDSLRTTARDHRRNFCFLSVLRGKSECVAHESYFRWVTRTCTRPEKEVEKDVNAPPFPYRVSVFVASFNLPPPPSPSLRPVCIRYLVRSRDKPERGRCNYKKEGNDGRYADKMTEGWAWVCNLTRHCHPTGITPAMIDIFRSDSNTIVSLARFRITTWNYLRSDAPYRFNTLVLLGDAGKIVNYYT